MRAVRVAAILLPMGVLLLPTAAWAPPWAVTYTLDVIPVASCEEAWTEGPGGYQAEIRLRETEAGDCVAGSCLWAPAQGGVELQTARLDLLLPYDGGLSGIFSVDVAIEDHCGVGCTRVMVFWDDIPLGEASNASTGVPDRWRSAARAKLTASASGRAMRPRGQGDTSPSMGSSPGSVRGTGEGSRAEDRLTDQAKTIPMFNRETESIQVINRRDYRNGRSVSAAVVCPHSRRRHGNFRAGRCPGSRRRHPAWSVSRPGHRRF